MAFQRCWGYVSAFDGLAESVGEQDPAAPVVAMMLARMKLPEVSRFIRWGRPVEELVRDHPMAKLERPTSDEIREAHYALPWAQALTALLIEIKQAVATAQQASQLAQLTTFTIRYRTLLQQGDAAHPRLSHT